MSDPIVAEVSVNRQQVLDYRAAAHQLARPGDGAVVLGTGLQDYPPGRSAGLALALRRGVASLPAGLSLAHTARGALHLHKSADLPLLRAALRIKRVDDWAKQTLGLQGDAFVNAGADVGDALDAVSQPMIEVMSDGIARTKGELSGALSPLVNKIYAPWCPGCEVHHVWDLLFRLATLQSGLAVELDPSAPSQFRYVAGDRERIDPTEGRAELVRRFLEAFGPAKPAHFATWLGLRPASARGWFALVTDELRPVSVDGVAHQAHVEMVDALVGAEPAKGTRLLPGYDPLLELADRELVIGRTDRRRKVWQAAANPGVLWVDGEIAGTWRSRRSGPRVTVTVEPFDDLPARRRTSLEADLELIRASIGADTAQLRFS